MLHNRLIIGSNGCGLIWALAYPNKSVRNLISIGSNLGRDAIGGTAAL